MRLERNLLASNFIEKKGCHIGSVGEEACSLEPLKFAVQHQQVAPQSTTTLSLKDTSSTLNVAV